MHCRAAARVAARANRKRLLLRGSAATLVLAALGAAGTLSATALRARAVVARPSVQPPRVVAVPARADTSAASTATDSTATNPAAPASGVTATGIATPAAVATPPASTPTVQQAGSPTRVAAARRAPIAPVLAEGQTVLPDGIVAVRNDSVVTLSFDAPATRTRQPEKFERLLRTTLPKVYGPAIDSVLATLPTGALTQAGNLVSELPTRGIHVPVADAWALAVYPETRPGKDGPLVVRYRVTVAAKQ